jgi:uncharacterized protein YcaQ
MMTKAELKSLAIQQTLFRPMSLTEAFERLGFVQADPIRAPARAEELILRQRVKNYRVGDLDKCYTKLGVEEDYLYAHGFMTKATWLLLHPRQTAPLQGLHKDIYAFIKEVGVINSDDLAKQFGRVKVTNWWGGTSQATRMALEELHYEGYVRIAGRKSGVRLYQYFEPEPSPLTVEERMAELIVRVVSLLGPVHPTTLTQALSRLRRLFGPTAPVVENLLQQGRLVKLPVDGVDYVALPVDESYSDLAVPDKVRFLAPFDPLVWARKRFEHLWGWPYRFEAYTPAAKRLRGYYALPLLWRTEIIGWVTVTTKPELQVEAGFVGRRPTGKVFTRQYEAEVERLRVFLKL